MDRILIVDDEGEARKYLSEFLEGRGFEVLEAECGRAGICAVKEQHPDLTLLDYVLTDIDGIIALEEMRTVAPSMPVVMITGYPNYKVCAKAIKLGAYAFVTKPIDEVELDCVIRDALEQGEEKIEVPGIKYYKTLDDATTTIVAESPQMKEVIAIADRVAPTDMTVIIQGETGTGKEVLSRYIHNMSRRRKGPFVAVDLGAIPETLIESELFGFEKGAFTGAFKTRKGKFELAEGGTILLDEITNLPFESQGKLLRVIEDRQLYHIGGNKYFNINARLIATSNRNFGDLIREERFRKDLFYRLNEILISIPPLRERKEDIPALVKCFIDEANKEMETSVKTVSKQVLELLLTNRWEGNIRELKNEIHRAVLFTESQCISVEDLSLYLTIRPENINGRLNRTEIISYEESKRSHDLSLFLKALQLTHGNRQEAARLLEVDRKTFYNKLRKLGF